MKRRVVAESGKPPVQEGGVPVQAWAAPEAAAAPGPSSSLQEKMEHAMTVMLERKPLLPAETKAAPATVCVTGANGYIGACIVARLLAAGHMVHAICRLSASNKATMAALNELPGADARLKWFHGDMLAPGGYDEAIAGCRYVIHTACPVKMSCPASKAYEWVISPALRGTQNVLASVTKAGTVEKIIMTSSVAALLHAAPPGHVFSETDWNLEFAKSGSAYFTTKTVSEMQAYALASQQSAWKLVTILPGSVYGPPLIRNDANEIVQDMRRVMDGSDYPYAAPLGQATVDVDDVAAAHTLAMVVPQAKGRYFIGRGATMAQMAGMLREQYPHHKIPDKTLPEWVLMAILGVKAWRTGDWGVYAFAKAGYHKYEMDCSKATRELGLHFIPLEKTLGDMMERLIEQGVVQRTQPSN